MSCITAALTAILKGLQELKVHFQVCGYDPADQMPPVTKIASIGSNLSQLTRYFNRLRLAKVSWTYWRVSWVPPVHSYSTDQFLLDCNAVLSGHQGRFFEKRLQVPYSATVGYLNQRISLIKRLSMNSSTTISSSATSPPLSSSTLKNRSKARLNRTQLPKAIGSRVHRLVIGRLV